MAGVAWVKFRELERDLLGGVLVLAANRDGSAEIKLSHEEEGSPC
jgi:hypothetical protein